MPGFVIIGLDFGMALTKCAVAIQPPRQTEYEQFVVAFEGDDGIDRVHTASGVWADDESVSLRGFDIKDDAVFLHGVKEKLLHDLDAGEESNLDGTLSAADAVFVSLAGILADVKRRVAEYLESTYPGATWNWIVNAATPAVRANDVALTPREVRMKELVEQALAYAECYPKFDGTVSRADIAEARAEAKRSASKVAPQVSVLRESLAGALFALMADDAEEGIWFTIDIGALTTDTSLFFFSPAAGGQNREAAYSAMASSLGGMQALAESIACAEALELPDAHRRIAELELEEVRDIDAFGPLTDAVDQSIGATLKGACRLGAVYAEFFDEAQQPIRSKFQFLILGGGSSNVAVRDWLSKWVWRACREHHPAPCVVKGIPDSVRVLLPDGQKAAFEEFDEADHAIVAIALGLAQRPWEMPRSTIVTPEDIAPVATRVPVDNPFWGGH